MDRVTGVRSVRFCDRRVEIDYPAELASDMDAVLRQDFDPGRSPPDARITIGAEPSGLFSLTRNGGTEYGFSRIDLLRQLIDDIVGLLLTDLSDAIALHAACVSWAGQAILLPGLSGAGKSTVAALLIGGGAAYLSDEVTAVTPLLRVQGFGRPLVVKADVQRVISALSWVEGCFRLDSEAGVVIVPPRAEGADGDAVCALMLFPDFDANGPAIARPLSRARTVTRLMQANLNARNLEDHGLASLTKLASVVPAISLAFRHSDQIRAISPLLESFARQPSEGDGQDVGDLVERINAALAAVGAEAQQTSAPPVTLAPTAAPAIIRAPARFTIGMATFDDYDGAYFTIQALRLYHAESLDDVQIVVIDNDPTGISASHLKHLESFIPRFHYEPVVSGAGTSVKGEVFRCAEGNFVLCLDSHVLVAPGAIGRLRSYFEAHPDTRDLLQGPLVFDDLGTLMSHFEPTWRGGMWGTWAHDPRADDIDGAPFEIPMQGMGLFACRRDAWLGYNPGFRGFGGEEGYIHEKFRQAGQRTLCLPFLRWVHRFARPRGVPYPNRWEDRIHNYVVGFSELGLETSEMEAHFEALLGVEEAQRHFTEVRRRLG